MSNFKKLISVLLVMAMLFAISASAFAAETKKYEVYTCLGDSIAAGCALNKLEPGVEYPYDSDLAYTDYEKYYENLQYMYSPNCAWIYRGYSPEPVPYAYHSLVANEIGAELNQCARSGMRAYELRYMLTGDYTDPDSAWSWGNTYFQMNDDGKFDLTDLDLVNEQYEFAKHISEADLVSIGLGSNDVISPTFSNAFTKLSENTADPNLTSASEKLKETGNIGAALATLIDTYQTTGKLAEVFKTLNDYFNESFELFKDNYDTIIKEIYRLNPDVTIVGVSTYNFFEDFHLSADSNVDISLIAVPFVNEVNEFIASYAEEYGDQYIYADVVGTDTYPVYYDDPLMWDYWIFKIHPNLAGHQFMAEKILEALSVRSVQHDNFFNEFTSWFKTLFKWSDIMAVFNSLIPTQVINLINYI